MPSNPRAVVLLALVVASANVVSGSSDPDLSTGLAKVEWFMATSDTAAAISDAASAATRLLVQLTTARAAMRQVADVDLLPPVRAFAAKDAASLKELVPQYWEGRGVRPLAASYTGPHNAFIAVRTDIPAPQQFPLLLHEYTHLLTEAHVPDAPGWLNEGLADFWGALVLEAGQMRVGRPPAQHLKLLRTRPWLSLAEMRDRPSGKLATTQAQASMFYAQSWATVHYLLLGRNPAAPLTFAPSERELTPQLEAAVRAYATEGQFREVPIQSTPDVNVGSGILVRRPVHRSLGEGGSPGEGGSRTGLQPISEARALAERANMLVFGERPDAALPMARRALSLDSREPLALEVMGTHAFLHNQPDHAREWLSKALDADPQRYSSALYLALLSSSPPDRERYLRSALRAKQDSVVAWQHLWALYGEDGRAAQARRWCRQLSGLTQPFLWTAASLPCDWRGVP